ncbi:MAG: DUF6056 family protein [Armatimonadota bacterium]
MSAEPKKYAYILLLALIILTAAVFACIGIIQPLMTDDFNFHQGANRYSDPFSYAFGVYHGWSGRFTTAALHWVALQNEGTWIVFGALNGIMIVVIAWLATALALGRKPKLLDNDVFLFALLVAAFWFCSPALGEVAFWRTGASAYIWSLAAGLLFLLPYRFRLESDQGTRMLIIPMAIAGVAVGMHGEQIVASLAAVIPVMMLLYRRYPGWAVIGWLALLAGGIISALGPGNFNRLQYGRVATVADMLHGIMPFMGNLFVFLLPVLVVWLALFVSMLLGRRVFRISWKAALVLMVGTLAASSVMFLLPFHHSDRSRFIPFAWAVIGFASTIDPMQLAIPRLRQAWSVAAIIAVFAVLITAAIAVPHAITLSREVVIRDQFIRNERDRGVKDVLVPPYPSIPGPVPYKDDLTFLTGDWRNTGLAKYYGVRTVARW